MSSLNKFSWRCKKNINIFWLKKWTISGVLHALYCKASLFPYHTVNVISSLFS